MNHVIVTIQFISDSKHHKIKGEKLRVVIKRMLLLNSKYGQLLQQWSLRLCISFFEHVDDI